MKVIRESYLVSSSKLLADITSDDNLWGRRFMLSALAILDPWDENLKKAFPIMIEETIKNTEKYKKMSLADLEKNKYIINFDAVVRYYASNPDSVKFVFYYYDFIEFWAKEKAATKHYKQLNIAKKQSVKMTYGQIFEVITDKKKRTVERDITIFSAIEMDGLKTITVTLNPFFMPFLIFINHEFTKNGYTSFPLKYIVGKNTIAAYSLSQLVLRSFIAGKGSVQFFKFSISDLRILTGHTHDYLDLSKFISRVIDKGIEGINNDKLGGFTIEKDNSKTKKKHTSIIQLTFKVTSESLNNRKIKTPAQIAANKGNKSSSVIDNVFPPEETNQKPQYIENETTKKVREAAIESMKKLL